MTNTPDPSAEIPAVHPADIMRTLAQQIMDRIERESDAGFEVLAQVGNVSGHVVIANPFGISGASLLPPKSHP